MIPARGPQTKLKEIPGLSHYGDERTCPHVLRAKHLLTTGVLVYGAYGAEQHQSASHRCKKILLGPEIEARG